MITNTPSDTFICTDSATGQYGRKIENWSYEFYEGDKEEIIDLEDYTTEDIQKHISGYGYSLNPASSYFIFDIYKDKETVNWVIAECIFENI
jgi:hypothetical protein